MATKNRSSLNYLRAKLVEGHLIFPGITMRSGSGVSFVDASSSVLRQGADGGMTPIREGPRSRASSPRFRTLCA